MPMSLKDLAKQMRDIDTGLLCTSAAGGELAARPMSNNREVEYDGTSWFYTWKRSRMARDVSRHNKVLVTYAAKQGFWMAVQGRAELVDDPAALAEHWDPELERWFAEGIDTPGITLIKVEAKRVTYWSFEDGDGEIEL